MKALNYFLFLLVFLFSQNLNCKDIQISILITDSLSKPVKNAGIKLEEPVFGYWEKSAITNDSGIVNLDIPYGNYRIIVSHKDYDQYRGKIAIRDKISFYRYKLKECTDYCTLEGQIKKDYNLHDNPLLQTRLLGPLTINLNGIDLVCNFDTTGNYSIWIPPGIYKIFLYQIYEISNGLDIHDFCSRSEEKDINFIDCPKITFNPKMVDHAFIVELDGSSMTYRNTFPKDNYLFEMLQYEPGIFLSR